MGCDIHPYLARRTGEGKLEPFICNALDLGRSYVMFGLMAGVRGDVCLFEPRGLPEDIPSTYKFDYDRDDEVHSASWLTTAEVRAVADAFPDAVEQRTGEPFMYVYLAALVGMMEAVDRWADTHDPGGGAILIFWFDS
ncbi:MAG: hypothetical protein RhofKO_16760 [Rhodothermales bacterium]